MKIRKLLLLLFSLIFALVLAYLVYNLLNTVSGEEKIVEIEYIEVLVANDDIEEASVIDAKDMRFIKLPLDLNIDGYYTDKSLLSGKYAAEKIYKGEYIHASRVIDEYSEKLSRDIENEKRAVAIYTDQYSAVADLLKPGDRVDLYVFIPEKVNGDEIIHPDISKLLLQNIKVLSIDQDTVGTRLPREETPDRYAITLEAFYKDIEKIVLAESIGYLKIALRPMGDDTIYITQATVWQELVAGESALKVLDMDKDLQIDSSDDESQNIKISDSVYDIYIVKSGDTLMNIARSFYGDSSMYRHILESNDIKDPSHIVTGRKLVIPKLEE